LKKGLIEATFEAYPPINYCYIKNLLREGKFVMKKLSSSNVRVITFVLTVVLFVLGSGAPEAGGGVICKLFAIFGF
jgi:hypothetical protein